MIIIIIIKILIFVLFSEIEGKTGPCLSVCLSVYLPLWLTSRDV